MEDPRFNAGEKTLLLLCEEGVEEYEPSKFVGGGKNVVIEVLDAPEELTREKLESFQKQHRMQRVVLSITACGCFRCCSRLCRRIGRFTSVL